MIKKPAFLTRNISILSAVSFATDIASEMLYPIVPLFLSQLGLGVVAIGLIEGAADAVAGLSKALFGYWSDVVGKRKRFVQAGYGLSAVAKPMMGFFPSFFVLFSARFADRLGKGIRTAARDAILVEESVSKDRGKVFGFHRSMDTLGATLGPIVALVFLVYYPGEYGSLFRLTLIPGIVALSLTFLIKQKKLKTPKKQDIVNPFKGFKDYWGKSPLSYKRLLIGLFLFALINSTDMFLLLRAKELFGSDILMVASYIVFNLVGTFAAYLVGSLADRFGFHPVYIVGLLIFAGVYSLMGMGVSTQFGLIILFSLYGVFTAIQESLPNAWLSLSVPSEYKATGLGLYMTLRSLAFLVGTILTGYLWSLYGAYIIFNLVAVLTAFVVGYFVFIKVDKI